MSALQKHVTTDKCTFYPGVHTLRGEKYIAELEHALTQTRNRASYIPVSTISAAIATSRNSEKHPPCGAGGGGKSIKPTWFEIKCVTKRARKFMVYDGLDLDGRQADAGSRGSGVNIVQTKANKVSNAPRRVAPPYTLWACGPLLPLWPPPDPVHVRRTRKRRSVRDTPLPLKGCAPPSCPLPPYARKGGAGKETQTPPPPPLIRERGAAQEVTRHPRLRTTGTRRPPPTPFGHARTAHANAGQAPATAAAAPVCAQGGVGHRNKVHGTGRTAWDKRPHANEGSARGDENGRAPHTPAPRPRLRARTPRERRRALQVGVRPRVRAHRQRANRNAQKRCPFHDTGASEPRARALEPNANGRTPGSAPPPFPRFARQGKTRAGDHAEAPPLSPAGSRARAEAHPSSVYALRGRVGRVVRDRAAQMGGGAPPSALRTGAARIHVLPLCAKRKSTSPVHEWEGEDNERGHAA
ncbi:hypothetical protein EDB84DRAFT_1678264 [Lactarius hengduanensis]|nr:hypothetical protein EDB84DRAFT_1678264 [Lactarius hengduanensis]